MPAISIGTTTGPGLWIEQLWFDRATTELITGRAISTLKKFCKRHGVRIYTIPGEKVDGNGSVTTDHRRVRSYILHSEYLSGSKKAAEKGER
jgi:hypothetical protein